MQNCERMVKPQKPVVKCSTKQARDDAANLKSSSERATKRVSLITFSILSARGSRKNVSIKCVRALAEDFFSFAWLRQFPATLVIDRHKLELMTGTERQKKHLLQERARSTSMLLRELRAEKSENAAHEARAFACSHELFELLSSVCIFFLSA